ncbi:MAG: UDP-galactopyranose mutase [Acidimicrobiales bacterium]
MHRVLASLDGQLVPVPCNLTTLAYLLGPVQATEVERLSTRYFPDQRKITVLSLVNHHHPLLRAAGREVYQRIFLQYTLKQWGHRPEELDRSVTARVPVLMSREDR